jgi:hypothetical protein
MVEFARRVVSLSICLLVLAASAGCGGGDRRLTFAPDTADTVTADQAWTGAPSTQGVQVAARALDMRTLSADTGKLALVAGQSGDGFALEIAAPGLAAEYLLLQVRYDATRWHVQSVTPSAALDGQCLFLGAAQKPGLYSLGLVGLRGANLPMLDEALMQVRLAAGAERGVAAVEPQGTRNAVDDLKIEAEAVDTLVWTYRNTGDYDQSSEVNVADLVPIGRFYLAVAGDDQWITAQVADGDTNGEINTADVTPIGENLLRTVQGYAVYEGLSEDGPWIDTHQRSSFAVGAVTPAGGYKRFSHKLASATNERWYAVRAYYGEAITSSQSNSVQYGVSNLYRAPRNLTARFDGGEILLAWDAPAGTSPDVYQVYMSFLGSLNNAWLLGEVAPGPRLRFAVPDTYSYEDQFYFAVSAVYGDHESAYSNTAGYAGTWEQVPPVWTGGQPDGGIKSVEIHTDYAFITWYNAVDLISPPVRYFLYWAPTNEGIDWAAPQYVTQGTTTRVIAPLTADVSYDFAVRAVDAVGNVTVNTNTITRIFETPVPAE